jgi:hypothetical protein
LALRQDTGALWEGYCITERIKACRNSGENRGYHFWRTYDRQEIDLIEESSGLYEGGIAAFEFKWGKSRSKTPSAFAKAYPKAQFKIINRDNYLEFI